MPFGINCQHWFRRGKEKEQKNTEVRRGYHRGEELLRAVGALWLGSAVLGRRSILDSVIRNGNRWSAARPSWSAARLSEILAHSRVYEKGVSRIPFEFWASSSRLQRSFAYEYWVLSGEMDSESVDEL